MIGLTVWLSFRESQTQSLHQFLQQQFPKVTEDLKIRGSLDFDPVITDSRPAELMNVNLLLPHYQDYDYAQLKALFDHASNCIKPPKIEVSNDLKKALLWIEFTCHNKSLPKDFFLKPPYLFPSGKSFVQLAQDQGFDFSGYLNAKQVEAYKSLPEALASSLKITDLNLQQIKGLLSAEDVLFGENDVYVRQKGSIYLPSAKIYNRIDKKAWLQAFESQDFKFEESDSSFCLLKLTNGCWVANKTGMSRPYQWIIFFLDGLLGISLLTFFRVDQKRRAKQKDRQRFTLQMLTHELRTPVTTLSLLIENMRNDFDQLTARQQVSFLNMSREIARLKNSMQMSYAYLQTDTLDRHKIKLQLETIELNSFLAEFLEYQEMGLIQFVAANTPVSIQAEKFWLSLCLTNLLRNAFDHGAQPVQLKVFVAEGSVRIEVQDAGSVDPMLLDHLGDAFQKGKNSQGLGLGLSILRQIMHEMKGRLEIQTTPTRFSLIFPRSL